MNNVNDLQKKIESLFNYLKQNYKARCLTLFILPMNEFPLYTNNQGKQMLNIPYEESEPYKCVEYCTDIQRLYNRLPYARGAIKYWKNIEDEIQISFFQKHLKHIQDKINELKTKIERS